MAGRALRLWSWQALALCAGVALAGGCEPAPELMLEHLRRGDLALAEGRYAQALAAYGHARELAPHDPRVQRAQMRARVHLMAETPARAAVEVLEDVAYEAELLRSLEKDREAVCLVALGNVLARRGDFDGARAKLNEAVKADPGSPLAHAALGTLLMTRRDLLPEARAELELALKQKPDSVAALVGLAQLDASQGDLPAAALKYEAALRHGDDFATRMALGNVRIQQDKHADAIDQFQRAGQLDPRSPEAMSSLGQALLGAGRLDEAARALRAAMQLRQDEATSIALGFTLHRLKKPEQALGLFAQVLAQDAGAASALYGAGLASEDLGRTDQALGFYRRLMALPLEGVQKQLVGELRREAQGRVDALSAAAPPASVAPAAKRR